MGFLYGRYYSIHVKYFDCLVNFIFVPRFDVHLDVPLGIKGIVAAIYEPPQVLEFLDIDRNYF